MCSITMIAQDVTMATTELMRAAGHVVCWPRQEQLRQEFRAPRMNWVVVTDENHNRRMQMVWKR
jgi:hypothetical protein